MKILIVEDDPATAEAVGLAFELRWPASEIVTTASGAAAINLVEEVAPDLVVLDLGLPDIDGLKVLPQIRAFSSVPVVILTARDDRTSIVKGLELGADDYIVKPFEPLELLSRAKAILRRTSMPQLAVSEGVVETTSLFIDVGAHQATVKGEPVSLTPTEWKLLTYLVRNEGRLISQQVLADRLWGEDGLGDPATVRRYISRLREKLGDNSQDPRIILTEHGGGYRFVRPR